MTPSPPAPPAPAAGPSGVPPGLRAASDWTWRLLVVAVGAVALGRLLLEFSEILIAVLVALLLTALLRPLVDRLARRLPSPLAALLGVLALLLVVGALFALVGQQAVSGFGDLRDQALAGAQDLQQRLAGGPLHLSTTALQDYVGQVEDAARSHRSTLLAGALGAASTATRLLEGLFLTLFTTFFLLSSGPRIWAWLLRVLPRGAQGAVDQAGRSGWVTLLHYVRATLIVAVVDGLGVGVGAALLGVPLALPLGVLVLLGAFVPVVGALVTGVVAVLVALVAQGPFVALAMLGVVVLVNQVEAHGLQPFLLGKAVEVHPLAVILAIAAGAGLAGITGALFAVPLVAVGNTVVTSLAHHGDPVRDPGERLSDEDAPLSPDLPPESDPGEGAGDDQTPRTAGVR